MTILPGFLINRCSISLQRALTNETGIVFRRFFSSQRSLFNSYVGVPEYPTPGTKAYTESMERLQDPRVLEMLSRKGPEHFNLPKVKKIQEWMQAISEQNAQLSRELSRLTHKVEQLENKQGNP
ncbi:MAG: hypothetical protein K940chlam7_02141 [Chlamydiae bacterium]|nr:hypothetical protein [Chlamydiota bacterium]